MKILCSLATLAFLVGCAHPISVAPRDDAISAVTDSRVKLNKKVGFYISPESLNREVTTPGGGGDNVRYFPYRDMEVGYQRMLSSVFSGVVRVSKLSDSAEFERGGLAYVFAPEVLTNSGSTGFFSWQPTNFSVDLTSKVTDTSGRLVSSPRAVGVGNFTDGLFAMKGNDGIAGQMAMQDALEKTKTMLFDTLGGSGPATKESMVPTVPQQSAPVSDESRLMKLKDLFDRKLIDSVEYEKKKSEILRGF